MRSSSCFRRIKTATGTARAVQSVALAASLALAVPAFTAPLAARAAEPAQAADPTSPQAFAPPAKKPVIPASVAPRATRRGTGSRGSSATVSPELLALARQLGSRDAATTTARSRGQNDAAGAATPAPFSARELQTRFGIAASQGGASQVRVLVTLRPGAPDAVLTALRQRGGATVGRRLGDMAFATVPISKIEALAGISGVLTVEAVPMATIPSPSVTAARATPGGAVAGAIASATGGAARSRGAVAASPAALDAGGMNWDRQGLTGAGVAVAIIDSGIDWKHPDFCKPDGTTRILALWDPLDDSFARTGGKVGSRPPTEDDKGAPQGTLYTREQINAALKGTGTVNSGDEVGHGSASAGIAAGNGRATGNGASPGLYKGVAPEADLIVVNVAAFDPAEAPEKDDDVKDPPGDVSKPRPPSGGKAAAPPKAAPPKTETRRTRAGSGIDGYHGMLGAAWAIEYARKMGKPCVVNMSYGGHGNAHDGSAPEERALDRLVGPGKAGAAICVSAGNEGRYSLYGEGRFGPRRAGQADVLSEPLLLLVQRNARVTVYFDSRDDWGLAVEGMDRFLARRDGKGGAVLTMTPDARQPGGVALKLTAEGGAATVPPSAEAYQSAAEPRAWLPIPGNRDTDLLELTLAPGRYALYGFAHSDQAPGGKFSVYVPDYGAASFVVGAKKEHLVGSPGNATEAITVGSYDLRAEWPAKGGATTRFNLAVGDVSPFSSPGPRRDGAIKPDVTAPGRFAISPLVPGSAMARDSDPNRVTQDGRHLAWEGTSASSPYVAGVVALMLQKNGSLDASQIRDILRRSVSPEDKATGRLPNPAWGYGKLDPARALANTPALAKSGVAGVAGEASPPTFRPVGIKETGITIR